MLALFTDHLHAMAHVVKNGRVYIHLGTTGGAQRPNHEMSFDHVSLVTRSTSTLVNEAFEREGAFGNWFWGTLATTVPQGA